MVWIELQGVEKICARRGGAAGTCFEDAEVIPAIGVAGLETKGLRCSSMA